MEDIRTLDRTLRSLGYTGTLERMAPAGTPQVVFHRDELRRYLLDQLRVAGKPLDSRELDERTMRKEGQTIQPRIAQRHGQARYAMPARPADQGRGVQRPQ